MKRNRLLWEARENVALSYVHKALLLGVACLGFFGLRYLGMQKDAFDKLQKTRWAISSSIPPDAATFGRCPGVLPDKELPGFQTREQLVVAMQERAETCVWAEFRKTIGEASKTLHAVGQDPKKTAAKEYANYADFIAKEETLARTNAKAARQEVGAILVSADLRPKDESPKTPFAAAIWKTLDEESGLHVIYEILWYACLLLGVGASSMLFVLVLTVLPITNGEGYWTKRIGEILERMTPSGHSLAVPFLAAAIGGGTLAGTALETQPGGQARGVVVESGGFVESRPGPRTPIRASTKWFDQSTYDNRVTYEEPAVPFDPEALESLHAIDRNSAPLRGEAQAATKEITSAIRLAAMQINRQTETAEARVDNGLGRLKNAVDRVQGRVNHVEQDVAHLRPLVKDLQTLKARLDTYAEEATQAQQGVEAREIEQANIATRSLAQSTDVDTRGPIRRWFPLALYHVGPLVAAEISARLDQEKMPVLLKEQAKTVMSRALDSMTANKPVGRRAFEAALRFKLREELGPEQSESLLRDHLAAILQVCKLRRL